MVVGTLGATLPGVLVAWPAAVPWMLLAFTAGAVPIATIFPLAFVLARVRSAQCFNAEERQLEREYARAIAEAEASTARRDAIRAELTSEPGVFLARELAQEERTLVQKSRDRDRVALDIAEHRLRWLDAQGVLFEELLAELAKAGADHASAATLGELGRQLDLARSWSASDEKNARAWKDAIVRLRELRASFTRGLARLRAVRETTARRVGRVPESAVEPATRDSDPLGIDASLDTLDELEDIPSTRSGIYVRFEEDEDELAEEAANELERAAK
jgi:hypothetical protein